MLIVESAAGICLDQPFYFGSGFLCCIRERIYLNNNKIHELQLPMVLVVIG